jgi:hypothetical protein
MILPFPIAEPESDAAAELGRKLFSGPVDFLKGVVAMDGLPDADRVEVCFAGRSNVGKSSLINALTNRKGLARASNTPGRTQEINFFELGEGALFGRPARLWLCQCATRCGRKVATPFEKLPVGPPQSTPSLCLDRQSPRDQTGG